MSDPAETLFEHKILSGADADDAIRRAGGERAAIRALLAQRAECEQAQAAAEAAASLGFRRGRQPLRRLP